MKAAVITKDHTVLGSNSRDFNKGLSGVSYSSLAHVESDQKQLWISEEQLKDEKKNCKSVFIMINLATV